MGRLIISAIVLSTLCGVAFCVPPQLPRRLPPIVSNWNAQQAEQLQSQAVQGSKRLPESFSRRFPGMQTVEESKGPSLTRSRHSGTSNKEGFLAVQRAGTGRWSDTSTHGSGSFNEMLPEVEPGWQAGGDWKRLPVPFFSRHERSPKERFPVGRWVEESARRSATSPHDSRTQGDQAIKLSKKWTTAHTQESEPSKDGLPGERRVQVQPFSKQADSKQASPLHSIGKTELAMKASNPEIEENLNSLQGQVLRETPDFTGIEVINLQPSEERKALVEAAPTKSQSGKLNYYKNKLKKLFTVSKKSSD